MLPRWAQHILTSGPVRLPLRVGAPEWRSIGLGVGVLLSSASCGAATLPGPMHKRSVPQGVSGCPGALRRPRNPGWAKHSHGARTASDAPPKVNVCMPCARHLPFGPTCLEWRAVGPIQNRAPHGVSPGVPTHFDAALLGISCSLFSNNLAYHCPSHALPTSLPGLSAMSARHAHAA